MRLPWLTEDQKFAIGSAVIFVGLAIVLVLLTGCASVFDAPPERLNEVKPVEYRIPQDKTPVPCEYVRDGVRWSIFVPRNECKGWAPV